MVLIKDATNISAIQLKESAAPDTPNSGFARIYVKSDGRLYIKDDAGTESQTGGALGVAGISPTELTIASGAITVTQGFHKIDTQADAGADDLDTINGLITNALYLFKPENTGRKVKFKHGTGNIVSPTLSDVVMTAAGVFGWSDGTNFYPQTPSNPNDTQDWNSWPDNTVKLSVYDTTTGKQYGITGNEIQQWRTYLLNSAVSVDAEPNQHFLFDSATAFQIDVNSSTPAAGYAWVAQVLTAPGAGSHTLKLPSGCTFDGTNNTASFNATSDYLEGKWISATRFLLAPTTASVSFSIT